MNRFRILIFLSVLAASALAPATAQAGGVWDPDDPGHRFDIRWAGAYWSDGVMRVTIKFYDPVRLRWFNHINDWPRVDVRFYGESTSGPQEGIYGYDVEFFVTRNQRLQARLCWTGHSCWYGRRVFRPSPTMLRVWVSSADSQEPHPGWRFSAQTTQRKPPNAYSSPRVIDRTGWSTV